MANMFALVLAVATLLTGVIWCLDRFKWAPARRIKIEALRVETDGKIDGKALALVARQPGWIESCVSIFPVLAVVFILRSFLYEPFQIPSGSMMPTLLIGDFILVEKYAYGVKDPITQTMLVKTGKPQRGDIAVFKYPLDKNIDYIKRVVGLPGDTVHYDPDNKKLTITPACQTGTECQPATMLEYSPLEKSSWFIGFEPAEGRSGQMTTRFFDTKTEAERAEGLRGLFMAERNEKLGSEFHETLMIPGVANGATEYYQQPGSPANTWIVPEGKYFMMGDNRDNSADSRYWGFVPEENFVGKATGIWMSFEKQEGEWPTGVRFSRIGGIH
ncbi:signal peptidase I [Pragia fontium]|uniref:Signal peptidase I n=2 Tax=Pragia fontium TaxID=82985 RepID=A0AAJ5BFL7_9GAMM|nr:signal peptidase I [Pragia fontium]AKJ41582.1 signal peptidase I [Pragia fontium]GKX63099.1 signal peptidase I [Pragia fontium]SFB95036.1 signal peptidase I . Serine peptidase. MEROPS family S26A [Pragia fontium DSM 5563 = ATCC 49100]VEJ54349.1 Signal peptidase I [Pragia fontium]